MNIRRSNCLLAAIAIKRRFGGRIRWVHPLLGHWRQERGWRGFFDSPWGHWSVHLPSGTMLSFSAKNKKLPIWQQLWFTGRVERKKNRETP